MVEIKTRFAIIKDTIGIVEAILFFTPIGGGAMFIGALTSSLASLPTLSKVFYVVGVAIILVPLLAYAILRMERKVKEQIEKPESLIFLHLGRFDAYQLQHGKDYVSLNYSITSALSNDLIFMNATAQLVFNSANTSVEKIMNTVTIKKRTSENLYIDKIYLGDGVSTQDKNNLRSKVATNIRLIITLWDNNGKPHYLKDEQEMIALS